MLLAERLDLRRATSAGATVIDGEARSCAFERVERSRERTRKCSGRAHAQARTLGCSARRCQWLMVGKRWCSICRLRPPLMRKARKLCGATSCEVSTWWRYQLALCASLVSMLWWLICEHSMNQSEKTG